MLSILLINDNKIVSRLLQLSSKKSGFDIEENGVFSPEKDFYNLIFVDSDKYSDELLQNIKENLTYDKLVFIGTAQVKKPEGFELVLEKPFLPTDFTALIEKNFIVEEETINHDDIEENNKDEDIDDLLEEEEIDLDSELDDLDLDDSSTEDLAQMVNDIDNLDENEKDKKDEEKEENTEDTKEIVEEELLEEDEIDDLGIDEDLLETDEEDLQEDEETKLPDIDDELEDIDQEQEDSIDDTTTTPDEIEENQEDELKNDEEKSSDHDFETIDKGAMKQLLEPTEETKDKLSTDINQNIDEENNQNDESQDVISEKEDISTEKIENIIKNKIEEILTPELIKSALKDMKITISFEDKE